jgi:four helix bundle protein
MALIKKFEEIEAWQMGRELCQSINNITNTGLFQKDYSLRDQIKRSSGSIMDNIAEGFSRDGNREFIQFLSVFKGSASEVLSQLYRALDYQYIDKETFYQLYEKTDHIIGKITNLMKYLSRTQNKGLKFNHTPQSHSSAQNTEHHLQNSEH